MSGIILARGKSLRLGLNKAFLKIEGKLFIENLIDSLKLVFKQIIIVTKEPARFKRFKVHPVRKGFSNGSKLSNGVKIVRDEIKNSSAMVGIYSGLKQAGSFRSLVVPSDLPFVSKELIRYMLSISTGFDVVVPKIKGRYEPLFAIYSKRCIKVMEECLKKGAFRISDFYARVRVKEIGLRQIRRFGKPEDLFMNINTKRDLLRVRDNERCKNQFFRQRKNHHR